MSKKRGLKGWLKAKLIESYNGACQYCGAIGTTFDHIVPVSKGGDRGPINVTLACEECNWGKRDDILPEEQQDALLQQAARRVLWMRYLLTLKKFDSRYNFTKKRRSV